MSHTTSQEQAYATLEKTRETFNKYVEDSVHPILEISEREQQRLSLAEISRLIGDADVQRKYRRLAIEMLDANVKYYRHLATPMGLPQTDRTMPVVVALLAAAAGYYAHGPVAALLAAAASYWLANHYLQNWLRNAKREADEHNQNAPEWQNTVQDWQSEIDKLQEDET